MSCYLHWWERQSMSWIVFKDTFEKWRSFTFVFNNFGTVIVLVQVLPNITSLSAALILTFYEDIFSRLNQSRKIKSFVALLRLLLIIIHKYFVFVHRQQDSSISSALMNGSCSSIYTKMAQKLLEFSVYTPEPETVLIMAKLIHRGFPFTY